MVYILSQHVDPQTHELNRGVIEKFKRILESPNPDTLRGEIASSLLYQYVQKRALAAGFDDYHDYFEASSNNFTDVAADSPELVLRKLMGRAGMARFEENGIDFDKVKVNPEVVIQLLADYPDLLALFVNSLDKSQEWARSC